MGIGQGVLGRDRSGTPLNLETKTKRRIYDNREKS
jgi:hypothetical protein